MTHARFPRVLPAIVALSICSGCASVMHGFSPVGTQINSEPSGAEVFVDGRPFGRTPVRVSPEGRGPHEVRVEMPGNPSVSTDVIVTVDPWFWGNCCIGGVVGMGIDLLSGHLYGCAPAEWTAVFPSDGAPRPAAAEPVPAPKTKKSVKNVPAPKAKKSVENVPAPEAEKDDVEDETAPSDSDPVSAEPGPAIDATPAGEGSSAIDEILDEVLESTNRPNP